MYDRAASSNLCMADRHHGDYAAPRKIRKILVSVKFVSAVLGPEMAAPILWTPGKMRSLCRKNHVRKIPPFQGGGVWGGGGSADFIFMGARIFLKKINRKTKKKENCPAVLRTYAAPIGAFFCPEIRAFTGRDLFNRFQRP